MSSVDRLFLGLWDTICAAPQDVGANPHALAGPLLGNMLVAGFAGLVTAVCFIVALRLLVRPGESNLDHPKYRILSSDR